jgi:hypothetical protein
VPSRTNDVAFALCCIVHCTPSSFSDRNLRRSTRTINPFFDILRTPQGGESNQFSIGTSLSAAVSFDENHGNSPKAIESGEFQESSSP